MNELVPNPYKVGSPVKEKDFYDRDTLLRQVRDELKRSNAVLLQGQRRIGKTSFLQQLAINLSREEVDGTFHVFFLDIQVFVKKTLLEFQQYLVQKIAEKLSLPFLTLAEFKSDPDLFRKTWLPQILESLGDRQLVLLVDEFDNLGEKKDSETSKAVVTFIRDLVKSENRLKWVFAVGRHTRRLSMHYSEIVNWAEKYVMHRLTNEETRQLICEPASGILTFHQAATDRVYELTSGQPSLTQALCFEIFERVVSEEKRDIVTLEDVNAVVDDTLADHSGAISSIARVPLIEERVLRVVVQLAGSGQMASHEDIVELLDECHIPLEIGELDDTLKRLVEWGLLECEDQRWKPAMELVRMWVEKNISLVPPPEDDWHKAKAERWLEFAEDRREERDVAGRINALKKAVELDRSIKSYLIEALEDYAQQCLKDGESDTAIGLYEELVELGDSPRFRQGLMRACLQKVESFLKEIEKPEVDKIYLLDEAQKVIKRGLARIDPHMEAEELKKTLKKIDCRKRVMVAEKNRECGGVVQAYLDLQKCDVRLGPGEKRELQKAAWKSLYSQKSPLYQFPLVRSPMWLKSMLGALVGLIVTLLLVEHIPQIITWSASLYAFLIAASIGLVKAVGHQRAKYVLITHCAAGSAATGFLWVLTSAGFELFPPSRFLAYVILIVMVATPLATIVFLEMSFTYGKARTGIVNGIYTLAGGILCGLFGGVIWIWLNDINIQEPLAAGIGLGLGWILVSLIMEFGDPASYSVSPDDIQKIFGR